LCRESYFPRAPFFWGGASLSPINVAVVGDFRFFCPETIIKPLLWIPTRLVGQQLPRETANNRDGETQGFPCTRNEVWSRAPRLLLPFPRSLSGPCISPVVSVVLSCFSSCECVTMSGFGSRMISWRVPRSPSSLKKPGTLLAIPRIAQ